MQVLHELWEVFIGKLFGLARNKERHMRIKETYSDEEAHVTAVLLEAFGFRVVDIRECDGVYSIIYGSAEEFDDEEKDTHR